jgi:hypothetical protein
MRFGASIGAGSIVAAVIAFGACSEPYDGAAEAADAGNAPDAGSDTSVVTPMDASVDAATCAASYTIPLPGPYVEAAFAPASDLAYVAIGRDIPASGAPGEGTGWLGIVDTCAGAIKKAFDPPLIASKPATSLRAPLLVGGTLYMTENQVAPNVGSVVRFDLAAQGFAASALVKASANQDELWSLAVPTSGKVWASGTRAFDTGSNLWTVKSDTNGQCSYFPTAPNVELGRVMFAAGNDVYQSALVASDGMKILHFDDAACASAAPCGLCAPTWTSPVLKLAGFAGSPGGFSMRVSGGKLYVSGAQFVSGSEGVGFVAELDLTTKTWGPTFTFNPTSFVDTLQGLAVEPDGTHLLAVGVKGLEPVAGGWSFDAGTGVLLRLAIPFSGTPQPSSINLPLAQPTSVAVDARGVYIAGAATSKSGLFVKCKSASDCPSM